MTILASTDCMSETSRFWHASFEKLEVGTVLMPNVECEVHWGDLSYGRILERYRPSTSLAHRDAVFMCEDPQDCDNAGAYCEWLFEVVPVSVVERHDMEWATRLDMAVSDGASPDGAIVRTYASNYWSGAPSETPTWEYLAASARIISVERY